MIRDLLRRIGVWLLVKLEPTSAEIRSRDKVQDAAQSGCGRLTPGGSTCAPSGPSYGNWRR
jgi:hypothetical protein